MTPHKHFSSIEELDDAIDNSDGPLECGISLNGGVFSRKYISRSGRKYHITNCIDDSEETLTRDQLFDQTLTNIGTALEKGALFTFSE